jgi:hypothetical protein
MRYILGSDIVECFHQGSFPDDKKRKSVSKGTQFHGYRAQEEEIDRLQELRRELRQRNTPEDFWRKLPVNKF